MNKSTEIRLQKFIAETGYCSRRKAEDLIREGKVKVNGETVTEMGTKINSRQDKVQIENRVLHSTNPGKIPTVFALYKPRFTICSDNDPEGRQLLKDFYPKHTKRLLNVGRLDFDSEGLILLTDSGDFAQSISHPSSGHEKIYHVWVSGHPGREIVARLNREPFMDGMKRQAVVVNTLGIGENFTVLEFILREGLNRQIKRMLEEEGFSKVRIRRVSVGCVSLKNLKPGESTRLSPYEVKELMNFRPKKQTKAKFRPFEN